MNYFITYLMLALGTLSSSLGRRTISISEGEENDTLDQLLDQQLTDLLD